MSNIVDDWTCMSVLDFSYLMLYIQLIPYMNLQRLVLVDGRVRTDKTYPAGFMGRFRLHPIRDEDAKFKLCKVRYVQFGQKGIPYLNTYDGRTIRYPDPLIKANDTIKIDLDTNKIMDFFKFNVGNVVMVTDGRNTGRVGVIKNREKHKGSFETIKVLLGAFCMSILSYLLYKKT
ncbi:40S ribosomal protein S4 [Zea mays]|uniref:40S ribosomal protein S4 n=1 Tax=Zea mays TaxID=4577 RepID=A0A317Y7C5_MAIZE|nr:40S ribosomal protein S4 [Zea mays]